MSTDNIKEQEQDHQDQHKDHEGKLDQEAVQGEAQQEDDASDEDILNAYKADLEKEKDKFLRLFAEFENYKRRTAKERSELFKTAGQEVMQAMLPVLDDFDRASIEIAKAKDKNLLKGVELIRNKLSETLKAKGLSLMEVNEGDVFDAEKHEAITQIPAPKDALKGKIVDVVEKGYMLGERIIRFPKVVVGN
ncbi:nucleotide exchange factor GrpE [Flavimarina sp. Hel_I_48]|uniref:nucleotide exchange factor GrpE n=1 Tax=Flavimarina sp. Hel_I_48 TaxID=1392488 RepID=UPI0004DEEF26|nr:nucleotide exchange factor GrpE [Flavimarina sp. Hel_I_48]